MKSSRKKLAAMYEEYLREWVDRMEKEDLKEEFVKLATGVVDLNDPEVYAAVVRTLVKWEEAKKALNQRGEPDPEPEPSGELDFTSMSKATSFEEAAGFIADYNSTEIQLEDILNATTVLTSVRPYMFDIEAPWVGLLSDMLTIAWGDSDANTVLLHFLDGHIQLEYTGKEEKIVLELSDEGSLTEEDVMRIVSDAAK
jgi:hypothetical protein